MPTYDSNENVIEPRPFDPDVYNSPTHVSVISPHHPNNRRSTSSGSREYIFRPKEKRIALTLGWELEANHVPSRIPSGISPISDGSVNGDGAEFVVLPALTKSPSYVLGLLKQLVHTPNLNTDESCGFHVHVSTSTNLSRARLHQWAIATEHLAKQIEDLAFDAVPNSRKANQYCKRITPIFPGIEFNSNKYDNSRRYHWLNIVEMFRPGGIRTIENRLLGHTHRWKYVLAWTLFTMELCNRGWSLSNSPFNVNDHIEPLEDLLKKIASDIKPLLRRNDPIPQWLDDGIKTFKIDPASWDRPLAQLIEKEAHIQGRYIAPYSDNQPEMPNESDNDEERCPCGCDSDGRCDFQRHEDRDCDNNYCELCHDAGQCDQLPVCHLCVFNAHDTGNDCQQDTCNSCVQRRTSTPPHANPSILVSSDRILSDREVSYRNVVVMSEPFYCRNMADTALQGAVSSLSGAVIRLPEELTFPMSDTERLASHTREEAWNQGSIVRQEGH